MQIFIISIFFIIIIAVAYQIIKTGNIPAKMRKAEELFDMHELPQSSELLKQIIAKKNNYVPARFLRAKIFLEEKLYLLAISELNNILSIENYKTYVKEIAVREMLALLYRESNQWENEIEEYKKILAIDPDNYIANKKMGMVYFNHNNYIEAKALLKKCREIDPSNSDVLTPLGISCYHLYEYSDAEQYLIEAADLNENQPDCIYFLGMINLISSNTDKAAEMFEAAKRDPKYFLPSLVKLGEIYYEKKQYSKAIEVMEPGLSTLKSSGDEMLNFRYIIATCYEKEYRVKDAISQLEKILKAKPDFRDAKMKLESYYRLLENESLKYLFITPIEKLQPLIMELLATLNYNVISKEELSENEYLYKAFNTKRTIDPPTLIYFQRTRDQINEKQIAEFNKRVLKENSKKGIYIVTSTFTTRAKADAKNNFIELIDSDYLEANLKTLKEKKK